MKRLGNRVDKVLGELEKLPAEVKIIAIDGRCASGKSTLAEQLAMLTGAGVIHMDDFFLPKELRTEERPTEPGGNVHYERFAEEVLPFIKSGKAFSYRCFDCSRMDLGEERKIPSGSIRIVEGAYSCHPKLGNYMDIKVFCDVSEQEQKSRIRKRNGETALSAFLNKWIPMEERYLKAYAVREKADIII